ncbi:hypothetical protein E2C01_086258 [Portunus trituberculatus]|uniref:Uncharacterized protein n=1 Tax=Portunus trituberculatus TaxID=210409 RepID=A0A5B7JFV3_PORTR|nr:hypothetical protein [Portunus trituberculatus]
MPRLVLSRRQLGNWPPYATTTYRASVTVTAKSNNPIDEVIEGIYQLL